MVSFYRPQNIAPGASGDSLGGASKAGELAPASVSAKVETQLGNRADITAAHKFFQPAMDLGKTSLLLPTDAGAGAQAAHAASQQVSPLIQLIMKMPGHIGVLSSFFDALAAFFKPEHWINLLDPHHLAQQAHASLSHSLSASEHLPISLSLLPHNAPIFSTLGAHGELASLPAAHGLEMKLHDMPANGKDAFNCSGTLDIKKPQFESGAQSMSGQQIEPSVSGTQVTNDVQHSALAGNQRLFSDRIDSIAGQHKSVLNTGNNVASSNVSTPTHSLSSSLNVSANPYGQSVEALPATANAPEALTSGPSLSQNVGFHLGAAGQAHLDVPSGLGPSGAVSDTLGGQHVLAVDTPVAQPNLSTVHAAPEAHMATSEAATPATSHSSLTTSQDPSASAPMGLKAKPLGLNAFKGKQLIAYDPVGYHVGGQAPVSAPANHVMDHVAHQAKVGAASGKAMDQIAHQSKGGAPSGKAIDRIAHKSIEHKVGDHVKADATVSPETQSLAAKPVASVPSRSIATRVDGLSEANPITKPDASLSGPYSVKTGDNLWDIARKQLGSGARWKEIYSLNSKTLGDNPSLIHVGTQLQLPGQGGGDIATSAAGAATDAHKYVVQSGDSLWKIAQDHMGGGDKWGQIFQANHQVVGDNPRLIFPGQELNLTDATQVADAGSAVSAAAPLAHLPAASPVSMQAPAAFGQPNMPGHMHMQPSAPVEAVADNGPGAVQAATTTAHTVASAAAPSFSIPKSLIPDLSFLKRKH